MNRVEELSFKLLDQSIRDDEAEELLELTQNAEEKETLLKLIQLESQLHASGRSSVTDRVICQILDERSHRIEEGVMQAVREMPSTCERKSTKVGGNLRFISAIVVSICAIALGIHFFLFSGPQDNSQVDAIAELKFHGSKVKVFDVNQELKTIPATQASVNLQSGDTIENSLATDTVEIAYVDGTTIELVGESKIRIAEAPNGAKELTVLSGLIHADVSPQPEGRPLLIVTREAKLEVLGTTLGVEVRDDTTQLGVATGLVAMTRRVDGQRVEVEAGQYATATQSANELLQTLPFPVLEKNWSEDFEDGLPEGWRSGKLIQVDNFGAVRAIKSRRNKENRYVVTSQNEWHKGKHALCQIDADSVLHMRFRQTAFARITFMIGTRSYPPATGRVGGNLFFTRKAWNENLPPNTWATISVPLNAADWYVRQGKKINGPPDLEGLAAYLVHVTTMDKDVGLEIDRIWITNKTTKGPTEKTSQ